MSGYLALLLTWLVSVCVLWFGDDRQTAILALEIAATFGIIALIVRLTGSVDPPNDLRMEYPAKRGWVVFAVVAFMLASLGFYSVCFAAALGMIQAPALGALVIPILSLRTGYALGAAPIAIAVIGAFIPLALLAACGVSLRSIGIRLPTGRSAVVTWSLLAFPVLAFVLAITAGHKSPAAASIILVANFFNNGFPEEVAMRGVVLAYARRFVASPWAIYISSVAFSFLHLAVSVPEEHGRLALVVADVLAENLPIGLAFAWMALRTRSLALGIIVHFTIDALRHAF